MTWFLEIICIARAAACIFNLDPEPPVRRHFETIAQCERAMDNLNLNWRPAQGAWKMNCVKQ